MRSLAQIGLVLALGCTAAAPPADAAIDARNDGGLSCPSGTELEHVTTATLSPDRMGWCCAPGAPTCNCGYLGGFVTDPCECGSRFGLGTPFGACDLAPPDWIPETDAHGCMAYHARLVSTACCNCFDAGS